MAEGRARGRPDETARDRADDTAQGRADETARDRPDNPATPDTTARRRTGAGATDLACPTGEADPVSVVIGRLGHALGRGMRSALEATGLDPRQYLLLRAVATHPGWSQQAVGSTLHIPASRMVDLVDGLERRGLVKRVANPGDRRAHALSLTAAGRRMVRAGRAATDAYDREVTAGLSPTERAALVGLLQRLQPADDRDHRAGHPRADHHHHTDDHQGDHHQDRRTDEPVPARPPQ